MSAGRVTSDGDRLDLVLADIKRDPLEGLLYLLDDFFERDSGAQLVIDYNHTDAFLDQRRHDIGRMPLVEDLPITSMHVNKQRAIALQVITVDVELLPVRLAICDIQVAVMVQAAYLGF